MTSLTSVRPRGARLALGLLTASLLALGGCNNNSDPTPAVVVPDQPAVTVKPATLHGTVIDAGTGRVLANVPTTVTVAGADASKLVSLAGTTLGTLRTTDGLFSFSVRDGVVPSETAPLDILVRIEATGYPSMTVPVRIARTGFIPVEIALLKGFDPTTGTLLAPPTGVTGTQATGTSSGGSISSAITATALVPAVAADPSVTPTAATISIPPNTPAFAIVDGNRVPAQPGPITVQVTAFSTGSTDSLAVFPGSFAADIAPPPPGSGVAPAGVEGGSIVVSAFARFNVFDSAGRALTQFDQPLTLGMEMAGSAINYLTTPARPFQVGDTLPISTFDVPSARWQPFTTGTVVEALANGNLRIEFVTNSLSDKAALQSVPTCSSTVTITRSSLDRPGFDNRAFTLLVRSRDAGNGFLRTYTGVVDSFVTVTELPENVPADFVLIDPATEQEVAFLTSATCLNVGLTPTVSNLVGNFVLTLTEGCETTAGRTNVRPLPNASVTVYSDTTTRYLGGSITNESGVATLTDLPVIGSPTTVFVEVITPRGERLSLRPDLVLRGTVERVLFVPLSCTVLSGGGS